MKGQKKVEVIKAMIANAGMADVMDVVYDSDQRTVRAIPTDRLPSPDEEQLLMDIFDSCSAVYVWLDGVLHIRRAQQSARAKRARQLYRPRTKSRN